MSVLDLNFFWDTKSRFLLGRIKLCYIWQKCYTYDAAFLDLFLLNEIFSKNCLFVHLVGNTSLLDMIEMTTTAVSFHCDSGNTVSTHSR